MKQTSESDPSLPPEEAVSLGPLTDLVGYALRRAQIAVFADFHERFAAEDIRPAQFSVLHVLRANPGLRQSQVSSALGVRRTNFVPLFDGLEQRGLAERRRVEGDRRAFALYLTEAGAALLDRLETIVAAHEARFTKRLGQQGKYQLLGLLHRLSDPAFDH
jgi:DNA-binding MarR family transcriptional regulator